jgi:hypothetical protein
MQEDVAVLDAEFPIETRIRAMEDLDDLLQNIDNSIGFSLFLYYYYFYFKYSAST